MRIASGNLDEMTARQRGRLLEEAQQAPHVLAELSEVPNPEMRLTAYVAKLAAISDELDLLEEMQADLGTEQSPDTGSLETKGQVPTL